MPKLAYMQGTAEEVTHTPILPGIYVPGIGRAVFTMLLYKSELYAAEAPAVLSLA